MHTVRGRLPVGPFVSRAPWRPGLCGSRAQTTDPSLGPEEDVGQRGVVLRCFEMLKDSGLCDSASCNTRPPARQRQPKPRRQERQRLKKPTQHMATRRSPDPDAQRRLHIRLRTHAHHKSRAPSTKHQPIASLTQVRLMGTRWSRSMQTLQSTKTVASSKYMKIPFAK